MNDGMLMLEEDEVGMSFDPYDFINEDFIKSEPEQQQQESNYANFLQTPPISPQSNSNCSTIINTNNKYPCNYQAFQLIPVAKIKEEQKFKVIQPKPEKRSSTSLSSDSDSTSNSNIPLKILGTSNIDEKAIKKHQRLIRNRESAIQSRKKKKALLDTLESENNELKNENQYLKIENNLLKEKLQNINQFTCHCTSSITNRLPSRNSTVLLAVFFMVGFNIFMMPIGRMFNPSSSLENTLIVQNSEHLSRNLLFADQNVSKTENTTAVSSLPEPQPIYLNQTENIRKANIENIRRWIRQPDFNTTIHHEQFNFNDNLIEDKLIKMYERSRDDTQKYMKNKKRIPKKKVPIAAPAPIQLYNPKSKLIQLNEFFEEINRQDDVFYVFSFKGDHMLLPAINSYNFSQIKMNLMMPARVNGSSSSETIRMMQIETIIVNTSIVEIKEKSIPDNFRSTNSSTQCNVPHKNSVTNPKPEKIMKTLVQSDFANRTDKFKNNFFINNFDNLQKNSKNNV